MSNKGGVDYSQHHIEIDLHNQKLKIMKLISNPYECGYCDQTKNYRDTVCKHPKIIGLRICNYTTFDKITRFPTNCPLQDGCTIPKTIEELIQLAKKEGLLRNIYPFDKSDELVIMEPIQSKPKRRNRKNCIYHRNTWKDRATTCVSLNRLSPNCKGVNCGYFEPKSK